MKIVFGRNEAAISSARAVSPMGPRQNVFDGDASTVYSGSPLGLPRFPNVFTKFPPMKFSYFLALCDVSSQMRLFSLFPGRIICSCFVRNSKNAVVPVL